MTTPRVNFNAKSTKVLSRSLYSGDARLYQTDHWDLACVLRIVGGQSSEVQYHSDWRWEPATTGHLGERKTDIRPIRTVVVDVYVLQLGVGAANDYRMTGLTRQGKFAMRVLQTECLGILV